MYTDKLLEALDLIQLRLQHIEELIPGTFELVASRIFVEEVVQHGNLTLPHVELQKMARLSCVAARVLAQTFATYPAGKGE